MDIQLNIVRGIQFCDKTEKFATSFTKFVADEPGYIVKSSLKISDEFKVTEQLSPSVFQELRARSVSVENAEPANNCIFPMPENATVELADVAKNWSKEYINYIEHDIMDSSNHTYVGSIIDATETFIAKCYLGSPLSVNDAEKFGFIVTDDVKLVVSDDTEKKVCPFFIRCYGVTSGNTINQIIEAARNLVGINPQTLEVAEKMVSATIDAAKKQYETQSYTILPFITGHSLGGMFANALALKLHLGSMCFNQLGLGVGAAKFVGEDNWNLALTKESSKHISLSTKYDFVSAENSLIRITVGTPGKIISVDNTFSGIDPIRTHCEYLANFRNAIAKINTEEPACRWWFFKWSYGQIVKLLNSIREFLFVHA